MTDIPTDNMPEFNQSSIDEFYDKHDSDPDGVYVVEVYRHDADQVIMGVFSTKAMVDRWIDGVRTAYGIHVDCMVDPFKINNPRWGNEADDTVPDFPKPN